MNDNAKVIENNLLFLLGELRDQPEVATHFPPEMQSCDEQLAQIEEYLVEAGEYGLGYELTVALLESFPFKLSSLASVKLLEVGLLMGFKTEAPEDAKFDRRS
ncbi:MAG TPA: hypothetical protein DEQ40_20970 [Oxalobacteraceae bacterium]|jgi:hypothetical protein|nr:hypothetical protein [Oxalobacteraceae bacterium]